MTKQSLALAALVRSETGKQTESVRNAGRVPGVVYGGGGENENISLAYNEFERVYREAGESSLIDLSVGQGLPVKTLIHDVQFSPTTSRISHVDFFRVTMTEKLTTAVHFEFVGESKAVKEQGAILVKNISEVDIRCFPQDLVAHITVDLSALENLEDSITMHDIAIPPGIEILHHDPTDTIVIATPPVSEAELAKLEKEGAAVAPAEVPAAEDKDKKEGESTAK
ncbi:50S ribosomal protein L25 [Candidatus Uhrbacteria bacterium]|nr:50S ribosomal protein L25 [Candidatus Uhrbacteria bacterium]